MIAYGIVTAGTGPERKHTLIRVVVEGSKVKESKPLFASRWKDICEDELRRAMRLSK